MPLGAGPSDDSSSASPLASSISDVLRTISVSTRVSPSQASADWSGICKISVSGQCTVSTCVLLPYKLKQLPNVPQLALKGLSLSSSPTA